MSLYEKLLAKIKGNEELLGILGLGYVGLPLAVLFARKGVRVLGFEKSPDKAERVNRGANYIGDVDDEELKKRSARECLQATTDFTRIRECDALIICVPTPLDKFKKPDMSYIEGACVEIGKNMKRRGVHIPREHDLPHDHREPHAAHHRAQSGMKARGGLLALLFAGAGRPGQHDVQDRKHAQGRGRPGQGSRRRSPWPCTARPSSRSTR